MLKLHPDMSTVAFSRDGRFVVTGRRHHASAVVMNAKTGAWLFELLGHTGQVVAVAISSDSRFAVTGSADGTARVWDLETGDTLRVLEGRGSPVRIVEISDDCKTIATGASGGDIRVWPLVGESEPTVLGGHDETPLAIALSADGSKIITATCNNGTRLWDSRTGERLHSLDEIRCTSALAAFSKDGKFAFTSRQFAFMRVWNVRTGHCVRYLAGWSERTIKLLVGRDGRTILSISASGEVCVLDWRTNELQSLECDSEVSVSEATLLEGDNTLLVVGRNTAVIKTDVTPKWKLQVWSVLSTAKWDPEMVRELSHFF